MLDSKILDFPQKEESVFLRIEVGESEDNTYCCFRRTRQIREGGGQWTILVNAKSLEDVQTLLKQARQYQRAGVEVRGASL